MLAAIVSILIVTASATSFTTYETYDCTQDYSSSRTWTLSNGTMKIRADFDKGGVTSAVSMSTKVTGNGLTGNYMIQAHCYIQGLDNYIDNSYGTNSKTSSSCDLEGKKWEATKFAVHYGYLYNGTTISASRYYKGMYYYEDGQGRSSSSAAQDNGIDIGYHPFASNVTILN